MDSSAFNGYVDKVTGGLAIALVVSLCALAYLALN